MSNFAILSAITTLAAAPTEAASHDAFYEWLSSLSWPVAVAIVALTFRKDLRALLSRINSVKLSELEVKLENQQQLIDDNAKQIVTVEKFSETLAAQTSGSTFPPEATRLQGKTPGSVFNDPWKGQFGGESESDHRRLSAAVEPILTRSGWFRLTLRVDSTDRGKYPLSGKVQFFIHDSFPQSMLEVPVGREGFAELQLSSWAAFTAGALADGGKTELELDLGAKALGLPEEFQNRESL